VSAELHHVGYVVDALEPAIARFQSVLGAGPFFLIEHLQFDEVTYRGEPAAYDHSSAFASLGPVLAELTVVHSAEPEGLREMLAGPLAPAVGHLGFLAASLETETARLEAAGAPLFHTGRTGPASAAWFDGGELLGHNIEVLQSAPPLLGFYDEVRAAARAWDGLSDPIRRRG
jgi:catechol 2,3-dioxygenase-like lactoylglutathione lyase family enzyme